MTTLKEQAAEAAAIDQARKERAEILGAVKEAIGEFLFRRSRIELEPLTDLRALGVGAAEIDAVLAVYCELNGGEQLRMIGGAGAFRSPAQIAGAIAEARGIREVPKPEAPAMGEEVQP